MPGSLAWWTAYMFVNYGIRPEEFYELPPQTKAFYIAAAKLAEDEPEEILTRRHIAGREGY